MAAYFYSKDDFTIFYYIAHEDNSQVVALKNRINILPKSGGFILKYHFTALYAYQQF
jgi:hypothetical protein